MTQTERNTILEAMAEQFMQPFVTKRQEWYEIDGTHGVTFVPLVDIGVTDDWGDLQNYYEGTIQSVERRVGFGARLSAPGYMDCTDWCVFDMQEQAEQYLVDTYGDDIELDEDELAR